MFGLETLVPAMFVLAASVTCEARPLPTLSAEVQVTPVEKRNDLSVAQLSQFEIDTKLVPASGDYHVGGLMNGNIQIGINPKIGYVQYQGQNVSCIWFEDIGIQIRLMPVVYVASEYKPGSCYHREVWYHELKHVAVDDYIAKKYLTKIKSKIRDEAYKAGVIGPVHSRGIRVYHDQLSSGLQHSIEGVIKEMYEERDSRQQTVDNEIEYRRLNRTCSGRRSRRGR